MCTVYGIGEEMGSASVAVNVVGKFKWRAAQLKIYLAYVYILKDANQEVHNIIIINLYLDFVGQYSTVGFFVPP